MKHLIDLLISRGEVLFNPYDLTLCDKRFAFELDELSSDMYDEIDSREYFENLCDAKKLDEMCKLHEIEKDELFIHVSAEETMIISVYTIAFDTMSEAVAYATGTEFTLCYDNNTQDYLPI